MTLIKATIQGYRSCLGPVEIEFSSGITVLTGPSGCGKSAILDAIRWGMGHADAGESMAELVFRGTQKKMPASGMTVELQFASEPGSRSAVLMRRSWSRGESSCELFRDPGESADWEPDRMRWIKSASEFMAIPADGVAGEIFLIDEIERGEVSDEERRGYRLRLRDLMEENQIIIVTDSMGIMTLAERLVGVTMEEYGLTVVIPVRI